MRQPESLGEEYDFPTNVTVLTSAQLGTLRLKLSAWYAWTLSILGDKESELSAYELAYDMALGVKMHEISQTYERNKPVKETLKALAIKNDERLLRLTKTITALRMLVRRLTAQVEIYKGQLNDLSREQTRREYEVRANGG